MSRIEPGMLVACEVYGYEGGVFFPPDEKRGLGVVLSKTPRPEWMDEREESFQVKLIYPAELEGKVLGMLESFLMPLAYTPGEEPEDAQPQIILSLVREIDRLKKRVEEIASRVVQQT